MRVKYVRKRRKMKPNLKNWITNDCIEIGWSKRKQKSTDEVYQGKRFCNWLSRFMILLLSENNCTSQRANAKTCLSAHFRQWKKAIEVISENHCFKGFLARKIPTIHGMCASFCGLPIGVNFLDLQGGLKSETLFVKVNTNDSL